MSRRPAPLDAERPGARAQALLLAAVLALQLYALGRTEGYRLADSVEYLERAQAVADGLRLDPGTERSFAFSALLVPLFAAARVLGLAPGPGLVCAARLEQMLFGCLAVLVAVRLGAALAGRRAALAAGVLLGANPVFLQYSVEPLAGTAAMLCTALGALLLLERGGARRGLAAGLWLGAALLMAFQTLLSSGALLFAVLLRERLRGARLVLGALAGLAAAALVQSALDLAVYGSFGASLWSYLRANVIPVFTSILYDAGVRDLAAWIYNTLGIAEAVDRAHQSEGRPSLSRAPVGYYLRELRAQCLALPALVCVLVGILRALARPRWRSSIVLVTLLATIAVLSVKGSKSFRLWLPILPLLAALGGLGVSFQAGASRLRSAGAWLLVAAAAWSGVGLVARANLAKYGGYWRAIETVEAASDGPVRVASVYHWAVAYRSPKRIELVKLPHPLDLWERHDEASRARVLAALCELDWLVGHLQAFTQDARLLALVNARFEIADVVYDAARFEELAPIYVLRRRRAAGMDQDPRADAARTFFELVLPTAGLDVAAYQRRLRHPLSVDFRRRLEGGGVDQLVLLGFDAEPAFGEGELCWLSYHWYVGPQSGRDYTIVDRVTDPLGHAWQNNHRLAYGVHSSAALPEGALLRESYLVPLHPAARDTRLGLGPWCRGELLPARLWLAVVLQDADERQIGGLAPFHPSGLRPIQRERTPDGRMRSNDGWRLSSDGLVCVGGFFVPVPERARIQDDGRTIAW